ncbi:MAG: von Willebrand factor type A domain-containing protein [Anaerolineae bacterium]|jgi:Ca-activated chloride channel family protein
MNCERTHQSLLAYLDGELSAREQAAVKAHLAECAACAAERQALAGLQADLSATVAAAAAAVELPAAAEARIADRLTAEIEKSRRPGRLAAFLAWLRRPAPILAGVVAVLVVAVVLGPVLFSGLQPGPTPEPVVIVQTVVVESTKIVEKAGEVVTIVETVLVEKEVEVAPRAVTAVAQATQAPEPELTAMPATTATPAPPQEPSAADMFFEDYGVNPFLDTEDDPLSTFALDVDTGAYSIARSYVRDGHLPPPDAVRVEEFVNYFQQGYATPSRQETFAIHADGAPAPYTETDRYQMLRFGIQGYTVLPEERQDVALTFVIDVSGSMGQENRLELVKRALELLVEQLRPSDSVAIVVYGTNARVVLEPTSGAGQEAILRAIYSLVPEGSTNAEAGLRLGYRLANEGYTPGAINRVVLCSDGVANVGRTGPDEILDVIGQRAREGITLTAVGVGMGNYNDVLMEQLADQGDGFYAYVDTLDEARRLFGQNLVSTLQAIALDAKVQVEFNPEVVSRYRLVGFENRAVADERFRDDSVDAGQIGAGHSVTALYEVKLHEGAQGRIATVHLRWQEPETGEVIEISRDMDTEELAGSFTAAAPYFQNAVVVAEYAEVLRGSYWAQDNTLAGVLEEAERVAELLPEDEDVAEFVELVRRASQIAGQR